MSGPVSTPRVSARAGHTLRHSNTSPLVMLNASFAARGDCAAQTITSATRSASAASQTNDGPPGKRRAHSVQRRSSRVVDTPLHTDDPKEFLKTLSPMGSISSVDDIASAVVYLTEARQITGGVLHVDGGAHRGRWEWRNLSQTALNSDLGISESSCRRHLTLSALPWRRCSPGDG